MALEDEERAQETGFLGSCPSTISSHNDVTPNILSSCQFYPTNVSLVCPSYVLALTLQPGPPNLNSLCPVFSPLLLFPQVTIHTAA